MIDEDKEYLDGQSNPPVINVDQMPLQLDESASQQTLEFKGLDTYVKENYMFS